MHYTGDQLELGNRYSLHVVMRQMSDMLGRSVNMVEVGLGFGDFATHLLDSAGDILGLTSVESWRGKFMKTRMRNVRPMVLKRMAPYFEDGCLYNYRIIEKPSQVAAEEFEDDSLDCVYIDADHSYAGCTADIKFWYPKVRVGGIISGHDYRPPRDYGVEHAVHDFRDKYGYVIGKTQDINPNPSWYVIKKPETLKDD